MNTLFAPFVREKCLQREEPMSYLVRFSGHYFYSARTLSGDRAMGTEYPSAALEMPYLVAAEIAKRLRALGYDDAVVATQFGLPATAEDLQEKAEDIAGSYDFNQAWFRQVAIEE
jgi:hypothetical protein